jgi:hypothetical protein
MRRFTATNRPFSATLLRDYTSTRSGLLSHNKLILTRSSQRAHLYVGSANLSANAWGKLSLVKSKNVLSPTSKLKDNACEKERRLAIQNWECGVLLQVSQDGEDMRALGSKLVMPFRMPADVYDDDDMPWMQ